MAIKSYKIENLNKPKSKYQFVNAHISGGKLFWIGKITIDGIIKRKRCEQEKEAAVYVDICLLYAGKEPVNVLKKKSN